MIWLKVVRYIMRGESRTQMIEYEYMDEIMVRYVAEQSRMRLVQREKAEAKIEGSDIKKGYAYINDEKIAFSSFQLPGTPLTVLVPNNLLKNHCTIVEESMAKLTNYDSSISLSFEAFEQDEILEDTSHVESWEDAANKEGDDYYRLDFTIPYQQDEKKGYVKGAFHCVDYRLDDWKDILFQIMYSVCLDE